MNEIKKVAHDFVRRALEIEVRKKSIILTKKVVCVVLGCEVTRFWDAG